MDIQVLENKNFVVKFDRSGSVQVIILFTGSFLDFWQYKLRIIFFASASSSNGIVLETGLFKSCDVEFSQILTLWLEQSQSLAIGKLTSLRAHVYILPMAAPNLLR